MHERRRLAIRRPGRRLLGLRRGARSLPAAGAAAALLLALAHPSAGSSAHGSAPAHGSQLASAATAAASTGPTPAACNPLPKLSQAGDPYGGTIDRYLLPSGQVSTVHLRPAGIDLLRAPATEASYYLGPRPSDPAGLARWEARAQATTVVTVPCVSSTIGDRAAMRVGSRPVPGQRAAGLAPSGAPGEQASTLAPPSEVASAGASANWAGELGQPSGTVSQVVGSFNQPGFANTCGSDAFESSWVGLGGWNVVGGRQRLVQAGTATQGGDAAFPFAEWLVEDPSTGQITSGPSGAVWLSDQPIPSGDHVQTTITIGQSTVTYDVLDTTTNTDYSIEGPTTGTEASTGTQQTFVDTSTAEWIDERPTVNGALSALRTWPSSAVQWPADNAVTYADGTTGHLVAPNGWIDMTNPRGASLTGPLTHTGAGTWTDPWQSCVGRTPVLQAGESLLMGQSLWSANGAYVLVLQGDGNLVEYNCCRALWSSRISSNCDWTVMQTDGNLVTYNVYDWPLWGSGTGGHPAAQFFTVMQNDGNVVIYYPTGWPPVWADGV